MGVLEQAQQGAGGPATPRLAEAAAAAGAPGPAPEQAAGGPPPGMSAGPGGPPPGAAPGGPPPGAAPSGPPPGAPGGAPPGMPPTQSGKPAPPPEAMAAMKAAGGRPPGAPEPGAIPGIPEVQATPEVQQEYERAMRAVARILYSNDSSAQGIVDQINPDDKVSTTSKVGMLFIKELDRKINMDENVIAEVTRESVGRIAELAEARHGVKYERTDMEKIIGATWEGVQMMYGSDERVSQEFTQTVRSMPPETLQALEKQNSQILNSEK